MKILFISLGCDKNTVDSESMIGLLQEKGYQFTDDETEAEIIIVNTCCFIGDAKEESINTILEMAQYKESGSLEALIVTGCLAQRYKEEIQKEIPEVDAILGTTAIDQIVTAVEKTLEGKEENFVMDCNRMPRVRAKRSLSTGGHFAYLKIAEGCDKCCSYCIIPKVRGSFRSVPLEDLVEEAKALVAGGVKEIILVAQETTLYGKDLYGKKSLPELLHALNQIAGLYWIRILYCYPEEITEELITAIKTEEKVCHYLDIPIQHASDDILKRMGRWTNRAHLQEIIGKLRKEIPDIALRTTLISGFPGETEYDHEILMDFVDEMEFDRLGVFPYSPEEDTVAAEMDNQIPEVIKLDRQAELMELQQEIAFEKAENTVGQTMMIMIEGYLPEEGTYIGRSYKDAPNVDGYVFVNTDRNLMSGDFVQVKIIGSYEYDLIGEVVE